MTAEAAPVPGGRLRQVGKVFAELTITNRADEIRAEAGAIQADAIRSLTLSGVLVDTGANTLCLPRRMVDELGLAHLKTVVVRTALGVSEAEVFQDARIDLMGRSGTFECLALANDAEPLLGLLPLEGLGLEPDLQHETLRVLPDFGPDTYFTVL